MAENSNDPKFKEFLARIAQMPSSRYVTRKSKRIKTAEYSVLDPQIREDLNLPKATVDWTDTDKELDRLNALWELEKSPINKRLLELKYDLLVEQTAGDNPEQIKKLKFEIERFTSYSEALKMP